MVGIALALGASNASAPELNVFAIAGAACPPPALLLSVELLDQALKRHRAAQNSAPAETRQANVQRNLLWPVMTVANSPATNTPGESMPGPSRVALPHTRRTLLRMTRSTRRPTGSTPSTGSPTNGRSQPATSARNPASTHTVPARWPLTSASTTNSTPGQPRPSSAPGSITPRHCGNVPPRSGASTRLRSWPAPACEMRMPGHQPADWTALCLRPM